MHAISSTLSEASSLRQLLILAAIMIVSGASLGAAADDLVLVKGGPFKNTKSNYYGKNITVSSFYIGKYDVTQKEWVEVMRSNPSNIKGDRLPVETVSWYDSIEYCNRRSIKEGLTPYYTIGKNHRDPNNTPDPKFGDLDNIKWTVTTNARADGYRLPTEVEWEYAAGGGQSSRSYTYSGSDNVDDVAWYWRNSGDKELTGVWYWSTIEQNHGRTKPVGSKRPNELGIFDMSGNVRQWCWDWYGDLETNVTEPKGSRSGFARVWKGGGWMGAEFCCASAYRGRLAANGKGPDQGFRVCRSA
jgi:formylglycine-generating enzyme required for sulfatase activity